MDRSGKNRREQYGFGFSKRRCSCDSLSREEFMGFMRDCMREPKNRKYFWSMMSCENMFNGIFRAAENTNKKYGDMMNLTGLELAFVKLSASIASGCEPCTIRNLQNALDHGISEKELDQLFKITQEVVNERMKRFKTMAFANAGRNGDSIDSENIEDERAKLIISIAASHASNNALWLNECLKNKEKANLTNNNLMSIAKTCQAVKNKAEECVNKIITDISTEKTVNGNSGEKQNDCGCSQNGSGQDTKCC